MLDVLTVFALLAAIAGLVLYVLPRREGERDPRVSHSIFPE